VSLWQKISSTWRADDLLRQVVKNSSYLFQAVP